MKRYDCVTQFGLDGWAAEECDDGEFVYADEAQAIIDAERAKNTELRRLLDGLAKAREGFGEDAIARDYQTFLDERERRDAIIDEAVGLLRDWTDDPNGECEEGTIADPPCGKCYRCQSRDFLANHGKSKHAPPPTGTGPTGGTGLNTKDDNR